MSADRDILARVIAEHVDGTVGSHGPDTVARAYLAADLALDPEATIRKIRETAA